MKKYTYLLLIALCGFVSNLVYAKDIKNLVLIENKMETGIPKSVSLWLKEELSKSTTSVLENFESPTFFTNKKAKIIGYIKNYDTSLGVKTVMFYYSNNLTRESKPRVLKIHNDGRFEMELPLKYPTNQQLTIMRRRIPFYLEPGQTLSIIIDFEQLKVRSELHKVKHISYQGSLAEVNEKLNYFKPAYDYKNRRDKIINMKPIAFKNEQLFLQDERLQKISGYEKNGELDAKTAILLKDDIILHASINIMDYFSQRRHRQLRGVSQDKIDIKIPEDYFDFIKDLSLDKQSFLVSEQFSTFINRLEFLPPLEDIKGEGFSYEYSLNLKEFVDFFKEKKEILTKEELQFIDAVVAHNGSVSKEWYESYNSFIKTHKSIIQEYHSIKYSKKSVFHELKMWNKKDSVVGYLGFKDNLMYEVIKIRSLKFTSETLEKEYVNGYWEELKKEIKSPYLLKTGNDLLKERFSKPETLKLPINDQGANFFKKLIKPYEGKILVVQFWNPSSFYQGESLKRFLAKKEKFEVNDKVEFLYLVDRGRTSKKLYIEKRDAYGFKNSKPISNDKFNYMRQLFQKNTSLWFVLVGKNGELLDTDFPFHNIEYEFKKRFNISPKN